MSWAFTLAFAEAAWIVTIAAWVLLEKRPPVATLAWIFGLALLPILGALVYFFWGPRRLNRKKIELKRARGAVSVAARSKWRMFELEHAEVGQLVRLATRLGGMPPMTVSHFNFYTDGDPLYADIFAAIEGARHHVHLEYYILREDGAGTRLVDLLLRRAADGIEIRLIADALGSSLSSAFIRKMRQGGIQFAWFNPTVIARLGRRIVNFRTHRKIAIVDGAVAFTGGTNICDDHSHAARGDDARHDTDVRLHGEAVQALQHIFLEDWLFASDAEISESDLTKYFPPPRGGEHVVQIIPSGPDIEHHAILSFLLGAIGLARKRIWLTTPYFVPDETLLNALCIAATRGVDVQIIIPAASDWALVDAAGASYHDALLRAGVQIHLFGPPLLHAKTGIIDDDIAMVGTANLDDRSFKLNFELAAVMYGGPGIDTLAKIFATNRGKSVRKENLEAHAPFGRRLFQAGARLLSPQL